MKAKRRHEKFKKRKRAERIIESWGFNYNWRNPGERKSKPPHKMVCKMADNLKACSCAMCCNPRRNGWGSHNGKTMKEVLADREVKEYNTFRSVNEA